MAYRAASPAAGTLRRPRERVAAEDLVCAFMCCKHERLGQQSMARILPIDICRALAKEASTYHVANDRYRHHTSTYKDLTHTLSGAGILLSLLPPHAPLCGESHFN